MSTNNIYFCGEVRKILDRKKKHLIKSYVPPSSLESFIANSKGVWFIFIINIFFTKKKKVCVYINDEDPDQKPCSAVSDLGLD